MDVQKYLSDMDQDSKNQYPLTSATYVLSCLCISVSDAVVE